MHRANASALVTNMPAGFVALFAALEKQDRARWNAT